jgi:hypothetical protein
VGELRRVISRLIGKTAAEIHASVVGARAAHSPYHPGVLPGPRMRKSILVALAAVVLSLAAPGFSWAARPLTEAEQAGIAATLQIPAECVGGRVSTVDSAWAIFIGRPLMDCPQGDGYIGLLRRSDGSFEVVDDGSFERRPCTLWRGPMPARVARDLSLCSKPRVFFHGLCFDPAIKPRQVIVFCADAGVRFKQLHWSSWGGAQARGRGQAWVNDCIPFCAGGTFHRRPVRVTLDRRRYCPGRAVYTYARLRYRLVGPLPAGLRRTVRTSNTCALSGLEE